MVQNNVHRREAVPTSVPDTECRSMCIVAKIYLPLLQAVNAEQYASLQRYTCLCYRQWVQNNVRRFEAAPASVPGSDCKTTRNIVKLHGRQWVENNVQ